MLWLRKRSRSRALGLGARRSPRARRLQLGSFLVGLPANRPGNRTGGGKGRKAPTTAANKTGRARSAGQRSAPLLRSGRRWWWPTSRQRAGARRRGGGPPAGWQQRSRPAPPREAEIADRFDLKVELPKVHLCPCRSGVGVSGKRKLCCRRRATRILVTFGCLCVALVRGDASHTQPPGAAAGTGSRLLAGADRDMPLEVSCRGSSDHRCAGGKDERAQAWTQSRAGRCALLI